MEPEPEPEPDATLVAPEFQIFTPPLFVGYLNGMSALIKSGVSHWCGPQAGLGVSVDELVDGRSSQVCPQGGLTWQEAGSPDMTLEELDVLLTGGRLTPKAKQAVKDAYEGAPPGEALQAAQQAIAMTAEFNTLGSPLPLPGVRPEAPSDGNGHRKPYKALILLFLHGGADTWNLLVPQQCDLYQEYRDIRTDLTLEPGELIRVTTPGQTCTQFGVHNSFQFLKSLYDKKEAAFISNVGNLPEPTTMAQWRSGDTQRCFGLFSHSDQQTGAQTLKCQEMGTSARGAGGRIADVLGENFRTASFSLAGTAIWPKGYVTHRQIVDERNSHGFVDYERFRETIGNITAQIHGNLYSDAYASAFLESIEGTRNMAMVMEGATLKTNYRTNGGLERELHQVAKLISVHTERGAERDFFFVGKGGWDMHSNMKNLLRDRFREIDEALRGFVAEMEAQGVWDNVALAVESEFARTLDSNGGGSDHAWAGQSFVIGGQINGGRVLNKFPREMKAGSDRDLGRGRLIPEYPWESMMVPIAEWMGATADQHATIFPNLQNFNSSHVIHDLFTAQ